jgi:hypothetical protein
MTDLNTKITAAIVAKLTEGLDIRQAIDAVMGEGAYVKVAGQIYDALRAKG